MNNKNRLFSMQRWVGMNVPIEERTSVLKNPDLNVKINKAGTIVATVVPSAPLYASYMKEWKTEEKQEIDLFECGICLMDKNNFECVVLNCSHELCASCITNIKQSHIEQLTCPFCRGEIKYITKKISISDW